MAKGHGRRRTARGSRSARARRSRPRRRARPSAAPETRGRSRSPTCRARRRRRRRRLHLGQRRRAAALVVEDEVRRRDAADREPGEHAGEQPRRSGARRRDARARPRGAGERRVNARPGRLAERQVALRTTRSRSRSARRARPEARARHLRLAAGVRREGIARGGDVRRSHDRELGRAGDGAEERVGHLARAPEALFGHAGERALEPAIDRRRQAGTKRARRRKHALFDRDAEAAECLAPERHPPGEHPVSDDADRPEIRAEVDVLGTEELLRAHVVRRADHAAGRGQAEALVVLTLLGDPEVEHLHEGLAVDVDQEHVVRLDVAVDDAEAVRLAERARRLDEDLGRVLQAERADALDPLAELLAFEELHHDVRDLLAGQAVVEDLNDVRALDLGCGGGLAAEAGDGRGRLDELGRHELDGDLGVERGVLGRPNAAHAALLQEAREPNGRRHLEPGRERHRR